MSQPLVLVSSDFKEFDGYRWHCVPNQYAEAVLYGAGCLPVVLPALGAALDLDAVLARVDGVLLTGSRSNVYPERYGVTPAPAFEPYDPARDATTLPLIERTLAAGVPLLAICRGFQELNVALGGTLATEIQEEPGRMDHRAPVSDDQRERFAIRHAVRIEPNSCLGRIMGADEIAVNSLHRQGINILSSRLVVEGAAPDGTIEAVRVADATGFAVGVQWHPEFWVKTDGPSRKLFEAFGAEARARAASRAPAWSAAAE